MPQPSVNQVPLTEVPKFQEIMQSVKRIEQYCLLRIEAQDMPTDEDEARFMRETLTICRLTKKLGRYKTNIPTTKPKGKSDDELDMWSVN